MDDMKTLSFTLAGALRQMLDDAGLHYRDLEERADIGRGSIGNYSKGITVPRWSTVQRWAVACGYDPDDEELRRLWEVAKSQATERPFGRRRDDAPSSSRDLTERLRRPSIRAAPAPAMEPEQTAA